MSKIKITSSAGEQSSRLSAKENGRKFVIFASATLITGPDPSFIASASALSDFDNISIITATAKTAKRTIAHIGTQSRRRNFVFSFLFFISESSVNAMLGYT